MGLEPNAKKQSGSDKMTNNVKFYKVLYKGWPYVLLHVCDGVSPYNHSHTQITSTTMTLESSRTYMSTSPYATSITTKIHKQLQVPVVC